MHHVILGAGPAGITAAETLRKTDAGAQITVIGGEPEPPYSRMAIPYYLEGKIDEDGTHLRQSPGHYETLDITYTQGPASKLDTAAKELTLASGETLSYDRLLIATGASPIRPPIEGIDQPGVHTCWTLEDARHIAHLAKSGEPVVLVGAGFIGSIILEALAKQGVNLTVVEMGDRMVPRMLDETAGTMLKNWCEARGIRVLTGATVARIDGSGGGDAPAHATSVTVQSQPAPSVAAAPPSATPAPAGKDEPGFFGRLFGFGDSSSQEHSAGAPSPVTPASRTTAATAAAAQASPSAAGGTALTVTLASGESLPATLVVIATGVKSNIGFLEGSGVETSSGIIVDKHLATSAADVFAAGDIAQARDLSTGGFDVLAIQPVAVEHGYIAALNMAGRPTEHRGSLNMNVLDTIGLISTSFGQWQGVPGGERATLLDEAGGRYIRLEFDGEKLVGGQTVGLTENVGMLRGLIQSGTPLGVWKDKLIKSPERIAEAYVATSRGF